MQHDAPLNSGEPNGYLLELSMTIKKGFTLIELLIVVAIIAILAAIAVPNFLEAQTRAKVARVVSDMRTLNTGIETYRIDTNRYPQHGIFNRNAAGGLMPRLYSRNVLDPIVLTTPIAYINSESVTLDTFQAKQYNGSATKQNYDVWVLGRFVYVGYDDTPATRGSLGAQRYGLYRFSSAGPDQAIYNTMVPAEGTVQTRTAAGKMLPYDATNGTVSAGDIVRTGKGELRESYL